MVSILQLQEMRVLVVILNLFIINLLYAQFLTVIAGSAANYLLAIFIFMSIYCVHGKITVSLVVGEVVANSPAEKAGIKEND